MIILVFTLCTTSISCSKENLDVEPIDESNNELYFPPVSSGLWETTTVSDLNWNESELTPLLNFLDETNTKAFIILKNGKIIVENYFNGHSQNDNWYWASAAKTLTAFMAGIAQYDGY